jgi:pyruvate/2-oxoglutarate dehydrogenase complex dihydrolipoamide dehydrogenase (E3) component
MSTVIAQHVPVHKRRVVNLEPKITTGKFFFFFNLQTPLHPGLSADDPDGRFSKCWTPYSKVVKKGRHVAGLAMSVSTTHVEVGAERMVVPFDSLLMCMGSRYTSNIKVENPSVEYRCRQLQAELAVMKSTDTVLIIGGGLVGVEVAANLADKPMKGKRVIIVQSGPYLLPRVRNAHAKVVPYLQKLGVEVRCNERVVEFDDLSRTYVTDKGNRFVAGKVYRCTGAVPNTQALADPRSHPTVRAALDPKGFVKVDKHLRLEGAPNIYGAGDILFDPMFATSGPHAVTVGGGTS